MATKNVAKKPAAATNSARRVISPDLKGLEMHGAEVTGGRGEAKGLGIGVKCEVLSVYINRFGQDQARVRVGDEIKYINPKFLKKGKPLAAARVAEVEAEREKANEPVLVLGRVVRQSDGDGDKAGAVLFDTSTWLKPVWFSKDHFTLIHKFEDGEHDGKIIAEVPAWKVSSGAGKDALAALMSRQADLTKMAGLK